MYFRNPEGVSVTRTVPSSQQMAVKMSLDNFIEVSIDIIASVIRLAHSMRNCRDKDNLLSSGVSIS